jgi:hypothetical protein
MAAYTIDFKASVEKDFKENVKSCIKFNFLNNLSAADIPNDSLLPDSFQ